MGTREIEEALCNVLYKENARRNSQREKYYLF
jgi:hypothetical protein